MSFIKNIIRNTIDNANHLSAASPQMRETVEVGAAMLAKAYINDIFRAADFISRMSKEKSTSDYLKIIMPSSTRAIDQVNKMIEKVDLKEAKEAANNAVKAAEAAQQANTASNPPEEAARPATPAPYEFKLQLNPKAWSPTGEFIGR